MVNGLHTASLGMSNILKKQDVLANNLANANTTGFKEALALTRAEVRIDRNEEGEPHQDELQMLDEVHTQFTQGPLVQTGNPLDLALSGKGFFLLETDQGQRYTRNGGFALNAEGELVNLSGLRVLDREGAPILAQGRTVSIRQDGGVIVDDRKVAELGVVEFPRPELLRAEGGALFANDDPRANFPLPAAGHSVKQGFLEGSNVDVVSSMVRMIAQYRNYEADQRAVRAIDETLAKAVNEVGRVNG